MTERTIASRYARATFDIAVRAGVADETLDELTFAAEAITGSEELVALLEGRDLGVERLKKVMDDVFGMAGASAIMRGLLAVLCENHRLTVLPHVCEGYRRLVDESEGRADALVLAAGPLDHRQQQALAAALGKRTGREVRIRVVEDPSLIGGVCVRLGNQILDGSARCRLRSFRKAFERRARG